MTEEQRRRFSLEDPRVQAFQAAALAAEKADRARRRRRLVSLEQEVDDARMGLQQATRDGIVKSGIRGGRRDG